MKIAVIVADANGAIHAGLDVERTVRLFEMPPEIEAYVKANKDGRGYITVTFAAHDDGGEVVT